MSDIYKLIKYCEDKILETGITNGYYAKVREKLLAHPEEVKEIIKDFEIQ